MRSDRELKDTLNPGELARDYWRRPLSEFDQTAARRSYQEGARYPRDPWVVWAWLRMRVEEGRMDEEEAYGVLGGCCMKYARYLSGRLRQDPQLAQLVYPKDAKQYRMLATGFEQLSQSP